MENYENEKRNKLGGGIITLAVIQFVTNGFGIIGLLMMMFGDEFYKSLGITVPPASSLIIDLVFVIITIIGLVLILLKNKIGIYIYFTIIVLSIVSTTIFYGFSITNILLSLILPVLTAIFIYKKKYLYFE
ncbi:hypothetical protein [Clostridium chrysemydis]|uniref:hypothetical protein n=1 Tax=Clostridium chrysemydis TaxID=2665504 RepID=UPI00188433AA|nr:hypothetical protein [Clostridium chrysemydis]